MGLRGRDRTKKTNKTNERKRNKDENGARKLWGKCFEQRFFAARMPQNGTSEALLQLIVHIGGGGVFGGFYQAIGADIYWVGN